MQYIGRKARVASLPTYQGCGHCYPSSGTIFLSLNPDSVIGAIARHRYSVCMHEINACWLPTVLPTIIFDLLERETSESTVLFLS